MLRVVTAAAGLPQVAAAAAVPTGVSAQRPLLQRRQCWAARQASLLLLVAAAAALGVVVLAGQAQVHTKEHSRGAAVPRGALQQQLLRARWVQGSHHPRMATQAGARVLLQAGLALPPPPGLMARSSSGRPGRAVMECSA
jgi:ribosomal protein S19E (S16A)